jgi:hypothetical protein
VRGGERCKHQCADRAGHDANATIQRSPVNMAITTMAASNGSPSSVLPATSYRINTDAAATVSDDREAPISDPTTSGGSRNGSSAGSCRLSGYDLCPPLIPT